jgi:hypothetical protein
MKPLLFAALLAALPTIASAGVIERACVRSDRPAATRALCGCIQNVADVTLQRGEQRKAAKFFSDPQKAQDTRQSNRSDNETFWKRYRAFAASAELSCG